MGEKEETKKKNIGAVMVIGAGIAGMQTSVDLAESGYKVYLVDKSPSIGGTMPQIDKTFPTNDCAMCILSPKLVQAGRHINIELVTYAELDSIKGEAGHYTVTVRRKARYVDPEKCTGCGLCSKVDVPDPDDIIEHDGERWVRRLKVDEIKCVQCGDCSVACIKENKEKNAMSSVFRDQAQAVLEEHPDRKQTPAEELIKVRQMTKEQRLEYWNHQMSKCIKCYGCRDVCPVFIDEECRLEEWVTPGELPPPPLYHLVRAYHVIKRCTHCGFCESSCTGHLPLRTLVDLVRHEDSEEIFDFVPGLTEEQKKKILESFPGRRAKGWNDE
jgi:ferredoxin